MLFQIGWALLGIESLLAIAFGFLLWFIWSHSTMDRFEAKRALAVYAVGCLACLALTLFLPL